MKFLLSAFLLFTSLIPASATTYVYEMTTYLDRNFRRNNDTFTPIYATVDLTQFGPTDGVSLSPERTRRIGFLELWTRDDFYFGFKVRIFSEFVLSTCHSPGAPVVKIQLTSGCQRPTLNVFGWIGDFREDGTAGPDGYWEYSYGKHRIGFERLDFLGADQPLVSELTNRASLLAPVPLPANLDLLGMAMLGLLLVSLRRPRAHIA